MDLRTWIEVGRRLVRACLLQVALLRVNKFRVELGPDRRQVEGLAPLSSAVSLRLFPERSEGLIVAEVIS